MILIADSGSTKTEWALVENAENIQVLHTGGFNPYFDEKVPWLDELSGWLRGAEMTGRITRVFYYGAGCDTPDHKTSVEEAIKMVIPDVEINVTDDLTGAARALFFHEQGVALILGTGTNAGLWDGNILVKKDVPRGYLLGDHGSGAVLGLRFLKAYLDRDISEELRMAFTRRYQPDIKQLKEKVYAQSKPNYFLASFSPFLFEYRTHEAVREIIMDEFRKLFKTQLIPLMNQKKEKIRGTGSVAFYYRDFLEQAGREYGLSIDKVAQYPLNYLVSYHLNG